MVCQETREPCSTLQRTALAGVTLYRRLISPLTPPACRFFPTCSTYAEQAFQRHGFRRGLRLTVGRLLRCHPFYHGPVYDPVPLGEPECMLPEESE